MKLFDKHLSFEEWNESRNYGNSQFSVCTYLFCIICIIIVSLKPQIKRREKILVIVPMQNHS